MKKEDEQQEQQQEAIHDDAIALLEEVETSELGQEQQLEAEGPEMMPTGALVAPVVALICGSLAPAWEINDKEQEALTEAYSAVLDKYFPDGVAMGPEVTALIVTAGIVLPRLGKPARIKQDPEQGQEGDGDGRDQQAA